MPATKRRPTTVDDIGRPAWFSDNGEDWYGPELIDVMQGGRFAFVRSGEWWFAKCEVECDEPSV